MKLAIASGKGGTGKTTLACALAFSAPGPVCLLDCDVEEPNCHFFVKPEPEAEAPVHSLVPRVDETRCTGCGACARFCRFNAIASLGGKTLVFDDLCHGCGGCARICPVGAITEEKRPIGLVATGRRGNVELVSGRMDVGRAMAPPVIRATLRHARAEGLTLVDCPPGTSCPFVTAVRDCDAVLLVTEPTPFGLHDLGLAVETLRGMGHRFAVVANRANSTENRIASYCRQEGIPLLLQIAEDRRVAEAYSRGDILTTVLPELRTVLASLPERAGGAA